MTRVKPATCAILNRPRVPTTGVAQSSHACLSSRRLRPPGLRGAGRCRRCPAQARRHRRPPGHPGGVPGERAPGAQARRHRPEPARRIRWLSARASGGRYQPRGRDPRGRRSDGRRPRRSAGGSDLSRAGGAAPGHLDRPACQPARDPRGHDPRGARGGSAARRGSAPRRQPRTRGSRLAAFVEATGPPARTPPLPSPARPKAARRARRALAEHECGARACRTRADPRRSRPPGSRASSPAGPGRPRAPVGIGAAHPATAAAR